MTKEKIDLGAAFEKLKDKNRNYPMLLDALIKAKEITDNGTDDLANAYAGAAGLLGGTIKGFLIVEGGLKFSDIDLSPLPTKEKQGDPSL